ncbi:MAG: class A beta-lactamase-related serine hydrolase [Cytophagales bacterium]|nr:class A beta-lactamase-related serine hydrolase [Cytophagales bacterium]
MKFHLFLSYLIITVSALSCTEKEGFIESVMRESGKFELILDNIEKYKVQIIYTQIDRDSMNRALFKTYRLRVSENEYFYPASSIKLPVAALAIEKINDELLSGFTLASTMLIDSAFSGQTSVDSDSSSRTSFPSVGHYIKKLFLVSDNDAYNRLYEFLGQREANLRLIRKGYKDIRITHRLSLPRSIEENRHTNPMRFYNEDALVHRQDNLYNEVELKSDTAILLGKGYVNNGQLINEPMDFSYKNAISLESLHKILLTIMFPENFYPVERFNLHRSDYQFLYEFMSKYPEESDFPYYGNKYKDDYCKFLMFAGTNQNIDEKIRIFNKIGEAYGYLIDMAYIIDFEEKIEFVLGAVIHVNENEILNDGIYEYETIGYPFMRDLGRLFYEYELKRDRQYKPDLSKYNWKSWKE